MRTWKMNAAIHHSGLVFCGVYYYNKSNNDCIPTWRGFLRASPIALTARNGVAVRPVLPHRLSGASIMKNNDLIHLAFLELSEAYILLDARANPVAVSRGFVELTGIDLEQLQKAATPFCWRLSQAESLPGDAPALGEFSLCRCVTQAVGPQATPFEFMCHPIRRSQSDGASPIAGYIGRVLAVGQEKNGNGGETGNKTPEAVATRWRDAQSLARLAGGIAHNFNNALAGLIGVASLAKELHPEDAELQQDLEAILTQARRMANWTRFLLTYAQEGPRNPQRANVNRLITDAVGILRPALGTEFAVRTRLAEGLPKVLVDVSQFRELCEQIIVNAAEATNNAGMITIRTESILMSGVSENGEGPEERPWVRIRFEDNGPGMPPEVLSNVFDPFFTTHFPGRGLGLAAVKGVVEAHGGTISVRSEPGHGTCFDVLLPGLVPQAPPSPEGTSHAGEEEQKQAKRIAGKTLLVIDDEVMFGNMLQDLLTGRGMRVLVATTGAEAEELLKRESPPPDLCLMDIVLPDCMGTSLFSKIRKIAPNMPVVVCSAYPHDRPIEDLLAKGAQGLLHKPFELKELLEVISNAVSGQGSQDSGKKKTP